MVPYDVETPKVVKNENEDTSSHKPVGMEDDNDVFEDASDA